MTNRENFFSLLKRTGYEFIPAEFGLCPSLREQMKDRIGTMDYDKYFQFPWENIEDIRLIDHDTEKYRSYFIPPLASDGFIDLWGVGHEPSANSMHMTYMRHPLEHMETVEEVKQYPFPDFASGNTKHQFDQVTQAKKNDLIAMGNMQITIWETAWYLRGMETLFCDMMEENEIAEFLFDKVLELAKIRAEAYVKAGADALYFGDDIGMQQTIMMSEQLYCRWLKPRLKELIDHVKNINPELIIFYHSCGFIEPFIPHLIEAGVDVLNPIQSECMDFAEIYQKYGDKLSFHGTVGTQTVMPHGTPREVKEMVWKNLDIAGEKGGLLVAPTHLLEPEVPLENIFAYVEACREYSNHRHKHQKGENNYDSL